MGSLQNIRTRRIMGDIKLLSEDPVPNMKVYFFDHNINEYIFMIHGLDGDYTGGEYIGKIVFDKDYPKTPPEFYMYTPSGRYEPDGKKLCLSNSKYHLAEWDPRWNIHAILEGFLSIFVEDKDIGISHIKKSKEERQKLAKESIEWNENYGKKNNNVYNLLKNKYLGYDKVVEEPKKIDKKKFNARLDKLAKTDKEFAKILKDFRKNIES